MDTSKLIGFLILTVISLCHGEEVEIDIHPPGHIKQGDTIRIICRVIDGSILSVNKMVRIVEGTEYTMMLNNKIADSYASDTRLSAASEDTNVAEAELIITDAQGSDSGRIGCTTGGDKVASEDIVVHVPVEKVEIQYSVNGGALMAASEDGPIELNNEDTVAYQCNVLVQGSEMVPVTTVTLGDSDITDSLTSEETPVTEMADNRGIIRRHYSALYQSMQESPQINNIMYDGQFLTCTSTMEHFDPYSVSVQLTINYAPNADPGFDGKQFYKVGEALEVKIDVQMSPKYSVAEWSWGENFLLSADESTDRFISTVTELASNMFRFKVMVDEVKAEDDFSNFMLYVENSAGSTSVDIELLPVPESTVVPSTSKPVTEEVPKPKPEEGNKAPVTDPESAASSFVISTAALLTSILMAKLFSS